jgi:cysteinyl-tRNA synthetase
MAALSTSLYNTLTQRLEPIDTVEEGVVRLYVCGVTPQDRVHVGHARTFTTFDVLVRHLRASGNQVVFVRNVTDVDDKILIKSKERGEEPLAFSARMAVLAKNDLKACGCADPDHEPTVSGHITEIIAFVETLVAKGFAYAVDTAVGRDVYYDVKAFGPYGKLSHRKLDDLQAGARVAVAEHKKDPMDFALWKGCSEADWGWPSPWGKGRPGWHIECSAMARKYLGDRLDIHGGAIDLIFPHHENEIAQSEAATGQPFSSHWVHGGFVTADQEKMSKSLGNFVTVEQVLDRNDPESFRTFLLGTQYRGPLAFDVAKEDGGRVRFPAIDEAEKRTDYFYATWELLQQIAGREGDAALPDHPHRALFEGTRAKVREALDRDLNTPVVLALLGDHAKAANELGAWLAKPKKAPLAEGAIVALAKVALAEWEASLAHVGLLQASPAEYAARTRTLRLAIRGLDAAAIDAKVTARAAAKTAKDWATADAIRAELTALGVELTDVTDGTTKWKIAP